MLFNRLKLVKKLLKHNGVMIITIDDHELFGLLGLLEILNIKILGIVCICIKPEGRRQSKYIMEAHEYAIFSTWGNPSIRGLDIDFGLDFPEEDNISKFRWEGFMRRDAGREDRSSNYWYPFYVSKDEKISLTKRSGYTEVWPINTKKIEKVWLWDKTRASENLEYLNAVIRSKRITIYYKRRKYNRIKPTSFWFGSRYNANAYGTRILKSILPKCNFNFPKSIYSVFDCIDLFLPDDGIAIDFFAGSGTTGHAILELNKDGKNRQFILCTNNENKICTDVCYPRIKKVIKGYKNSENKMIKGLDGNLKYFKTDFVDWSYHTKQNKKKLVERSTEMLCLKENCFELVKNGNKFKVFMNNQKWLGIVYHRTGIKPYKTWLKSNKSTTKINTYVFPPKDEINDDEFHDVIKSVNLKPIPVAILNVYRRIFDHV